MPQYEDPADQFIERTDLAAEPIFGSPRELDEVRELIMLAYEQAQASGRNDWTKMTSAVLKNRILSITDREFDEKDYGARTFLHLLTLLPDLVQIEGTRAPHMVKLMRSSGSSLREETQGIGLDGIEINQRTDWRQIRVRADLWGAVMDYTTGARYVLDEMTRIARPAQTEEDHLPSLPTVDRNVLQEWRRDFISGLTAEDSTPTLLEKLADWEATGGRSLALPPPLRGSWNQTLKKRVLERLKEWFAATDSPVPYNLLVKISPTQTTTRLSDTRQLRALRDLIIAHIRVMTYEELLALHIPTSAIVRMRRP